MKAITILNTDLKFQFNPPAEENWGISEDFNYLEKPANATIGIIELINNPLAQIIIWKIFQILYEQSKVQKLDYLQKLSINETDVWAIHNGDYMTLLLPDEY